ncbi:MAG: phosphopentomutase [Clostridium sp.]
MGKFKRVFLVIMDSVGIGELPDADKFGDTGANTIGNIAKYCKGITLPNMEKMGIGNIADIEGVNKVLNPTAYYTKSNEVSCGKDTITGHWEMMGVYTEKPFKAFTDTGFPKKLIDELEEKTGHKFIGNIASSGTTILTELGEEHMKTKSLILYTSADSVLQIAANEDIVSLEELYRVCEISREITLKEEYKVARVIARPFIGTNKENFTRTTGRHDYALTPPCRTVLDELKDSGTNVVSVGKIGDIYSNQGINKSIKTISNDDGMDKVIEIAKSDSENSFIFLNLVDFDSVYGHRRDILGYKNALESFDGRLSELLKELKEDDLLIMTADHGNDPTCPGSDHTREYVPVIVYGKSLDGQKELPILGSMADIGVTILENFNGTDKDYGFEIGKSFYSSIR